MTGEHYTRPRGGFRASCRTLWLSVLLLASRVWGVQTGQWNFDGNHNDSVGSNAGTFVGTEAYTNGYIGRAISFNGSSYLNLGTGVLSTSAYTKTAWIRRTGTGNNNIISGNNTSGLHAFWLPSFRLSAGHNGNWTAVQDNTLLPTNVWTHVAVTYDAAVNGGTLRLYRNGRLAGGVAVASNVASPTGGAVQIGAHNNGNNFAGQIDEVRLWNNALAADEILQVYKAGMQSHRAVYGLVPEAVDYEIVYELPIPDASSLGTTGMAAYSFDNSDAFGSGLGFDRVAYYLEVASTTGASQWVFVSMDPFTFKAKQLGVPSVASGASFQQQLTHLNVAAGGAVVTTGNDIQTGNIEFWGYNYSQANAAGVPGGNASVFDFGDTINPAGTYGSMQIHNYGTGQTLFAYNRWGAGGNSDLGIGNRAATDPDWTFAQNAASYTNKVLLAMVRPAAVPIVNFTAMPKSLQLYPRDLVTSRATVQFSGSVLSTGCTQIAVSVTRAGVAYSNVIQALTYTGGSAPFSVAIPIHAELADYDVQVVVTQNGKDYLVATADDVVAGDAFLVNGQSNAEAMSRSGSANGNQSSWIRSFGYHSATAASVQGDLNWHLAEGDAAEGPGAIGQWGLRLARMLVDSNAVPIAVINNALGGQTISYFQCNDSDPANPAVNYGQLLYRVRQAGLGNSIRAILWYQGETDKGDADAHERGWLELYRHWLLDYPTVEKVYVCQLHVAVCGVPTWTVDLRDRQRRWADTYGNIEAMSTTGLQQLADNCHFAYDPGYRQLGEQLGRLVLRDLYGLAQPSQISPPNLEAAYLADSSGTNVILVTRNPQDQLTLNAGVGADFRLEGDRDMTNVLVLSATASGNTIQLTFNTNALLATGISYSGHTGGAPFLTNALGLGLLSFHNQPILASLVVPTVPSGLQTIPVCSNRIDLAWHTNNAAAHYLVRRDGIILGAPYEPRFIDRSVTAGIGYNYQIAAVSPAGTSAWSSVVSGSAALHNVFTNVPEASNYDILYLLDVPADHRVGTTLDVGYAVNNAAQYDKPFWRVAYYLELQDQPGTPLRWVYVSMNAFTNNPVYLGVPVVAKGQTFQMPVGDMNIFASANSGIVPGQHLTTGNIEFWGYNYTSTNAASVPNASELTYDHGDQINLSGIYGSMQIHNADVDGAGPGTSAQVLLAYNNWAASGSDDLGIGNATGAASDWTFAANAQTWNFKRLYVLVRPVSPLQITPTLVGNQLKLSWPEAHPGWRLESQTNRIGAGLGTNWFTASASLPTNEITLPLSQTNGSVFFRLVYP